jgi:hypothetical protein
MNAKPASLTVTMTVTMRSMETSNRGWMAR